MFTHRYSRIALVMFLLLSGLWSCKRKVAATAPSAPAASPAVAAALERPPAPTLTLRADNSTINRGQSATLTVTTRNATSVSIEPGIGSVPVNGSRQVAPQSSVTYIATAIGPGGTIGDSVRLTVSEPALVATPVRAVTPAGNSGAPATPLDDRIKQEMQPIYFDYDKADIREDQKQRIHSEAAFLMQNPALRFLIEGNCDETGSEEYNQALGERQASAVKQFLVSLGIAETRLSTISYGEERPVCRESTDECSPRNRRAAYSRVP